MSRINNEAQDLVARWLSIRSDYPKSFSFTSDSELNRLGLSLDRCDLLHLVGTPWFVTPHLWFPDTGVNPIKSSEWFVLATAPDQRLIAINRADDCSVWILHNKNILGFDPSDYDPNSELTANGKLVTQMFFNSSPNHLVKTLLTVAEFVDSVAKNNNGEFKDLTLNKKTIDRFLTKLEVVDIKAYKDQTSFWRRWAGFMASEKNGRNFSID